MTCTRRTFLRFSLVSAVSMTAKQAFAQGVATHKAKPVVRHAPSGRPFNAHFVDVAAAAGLSAPTIYGGVESKKYILESTGCGCAFIDYDNDGWLDIFLLCGTRIEAAPPAATNRLYKNNRDGTFTDVTQKAGLHAIGWASGVCVGDYNNDGFEDMFCTYFGQNILYRNNGDGTFTDVTKAAGLLNDQPRWGAGCSFLDYNRDGHLDLFVSNYVRFSIEHAPVPGENTNCNWKGIPVECGPRGLPTGWHSLYRNNGDGTFSDVSQLAGIARATQCYGMTVVAADLDEDGWPDIYVACDSTPSLLFMNNHDGTFREEGVLRGVALSDDGEEQAGMGVAIGDYDLDGHLDLFKTHFADDANVLYHNDGKGAFDDVTRASRVGVETRYVCWGAGIVDLDNDGCPDLFMVTGNVYPEVERKLPQYQNKTPRAVFRNLGNSTFEELIDAAGPGVAEEHCSRGCAFGDFDNDGDVDILIVNLNETPSLLRNDLIGNQNWVKVKLEGVKSNRSAIGARVLAHYGGKTQAQSVLSQCSFYSCNDPRLHFGLGTHTTVDLEVRWPNGMVEAFKRMPVNRLVTLREGAGMVQNRGWLKS
ncbi:MAG: RNA-binding protein [Acidobacteria bacterium]|nr:MAG: RNA-binding protein [Acidobacteriota bacterium]PYU66451.1 MAG: RNA-binding protein [Acidobacteriota bacterium]